MRLTNAPNCVGQTRFGLLTVRMPIAWLQQVDWQVNPFWQHLEVHHDVPARFITNVDYFGEPTHER